MAGSFAKLVVSLGANISSFETDMKRATTNQKRRMKEMEAQVQQAGRAIAVAFAAVATSTGAVVRSSIKAADEMQKLAQRTGLSTEALSEYKHIADLSGVSFEQFTNGMKRMQRSISDAEVGLSTQARAFERLGISTSELIKLSPDQQFERIAQAMTGLESATLRSATAQEIFGRSGTELLSVMSEGEAGIKAMREEAARLGLTIGADFANQAALFDDNLARMKAGFVGAGNALTAALLPALLDLQAYFMESGNSMDFATAAGEKLGAVLKTLTAAFVIIKNAALAFGKILLGVFDLLLGIAQTTIAPLVGAVRALVDAFAALKAGDFTAAGAAISKVGANIGKEFEAAAERIKNAGGFILETVGNLDEGLDEVNKLFNTTADLTGLATSKFKESATAIKNTAKATEELADAGEDINEFLDRQIELYEDSQKALADYERSLQNVLDSIYPLQAEGRRLGEVLALLNLGLERGDLTLAQFEDAVRRVTDAFNQAAGSTDNFEQGLKVVDEGARILERSFQSMWENILSGADNTWDSVLDGFKSMLARMVHEATTQKIILNIQSGLQGTGSGANGGINFGDLSQDLIAAAGSILGISSADTLFGQIGSSLGSLFGETLFSKLGTALFPKLLAGLGSFAGPIGTALGAILGSALGDLVGGLFERKLAFTLGGANAGTGSQNIRTPLGQIVGISGQGGFGSLNDSSTFGGQLAKALTEFDTQIAEFLKGFASDEQFSAVTRSLENWVGSFGEGADAADVLSSRFRVILGNFSGDIQEFVNGAADFEEQLNRFGVALTADKLLRENPELFSGRTTGDILNLVSAFQSGAETMEDAFREFLALFSRVAAVSDSLRSFANSNLAEDFAALGLDLTTAEALARVNSELMDAVATFDGSVDSFEKIGTLAMLAREGELKLLSEIDAIQKGINSNLDKLKADILGINAPDATGEQLFLEAQKLIGQITDQSSAADLAALEQQFNSIIRSIAPEDQLFMQSEILALIETFRARANPVFDARRNETLDNAQAMREMVDGFLVRIGDPLDIIAASLDGVNLQETMNEGLDAIDQSVQQIGPQVAAALAQGLSQVSFTINLDGGGLVTQ